MAGRSLRCWVGGVTLGVLVGAQGTPGLAAEIRRGDAEGATYRLEGPIEAADTLRLARLFREDAADPDSEVTARASVRAVVGAFDLQACSPRSS